MFYFVIGALQTQLWYDMIYLRHIIRIPYTAHVLKLTVRKRTNQRHVTSTILDRRLKLFGHICRADPSHDHARPKFPSTVNQRIGDVRAVVSASPGCGQSKETKVYRGSTSHWTQTHNIDLSLLNLVYYTSTFPLAPCWGNNYAAGGASHSMMMTMTGVCGHPKVKDCEVTGTCK